MIFSQLRLETSMPCLMLKQIQVKQLHSNQCNCQSLQWKIIWKENQLSCWEKRNTQKWNVQQEGLNSHTIETTHPRRNTDYTNPHRTSDFETLKWTEGGFVQTVFDEHSCDVIGSSACYTFGRQKHTTKVFRQSCTHMYRLLLLCGDVESNRWNQAQERKNV